MKKFLLLSILSVLAVGAVSSQQLSLKEVIARSARGIEEALPQRTTVVVLNFASASEKFSDYVIEELSSDLIEGGKITIVDRTNLAHVREEMQLQLSGDVSDESALSVGKMLGAHYIVSGVLSDNGVNYRFRIRIINVETTAVQSQISLDLKNDEQVTFLLGDKSAKRISLPTSNVRNNWLSGELRMYGIGAKYERMLGSKISLGVNVFLGIPIPNFYELDIIGADVFIRFYPWGKTFFMGTAFGYRYVKWGNDEDVTNAMSITPEIGWKFDVGNPGGFYLQPSIYQPLLLGEFFDSSFSMTGLFFGMGWAF